MFKRQVYIGSYNGLDEFNVTVNEMDDGRWSWKVDSCLADAYSCETTGIEATCEEARRAGLLEIVRRCDAEKARALKLLEAHDGV